MQHPAERGAISILLVIGLGVGVSRGADLLEVCPGQWTFVSRKTARRAARA
jgi:uncharacterized iron-regulated membrane protein